MLLEVGIEILRIVNRFGGASDFTADVANGLPRDVGSSATVGSRVGATNRIAERCPKTGHSSDSRLAASHLSFEEHLRDQRPQRNGWRVDRAFVVAKVEFMSIENFLPLVTVENFYHWEFI